MARGENLYVSVGDRVQFQHGGPVMRVQRAFGRGGEELVELELPGGQRVFRHTELYELECAWFDKNDVFHERRFRADELKDVSEQSDP